MAAIKEDRLVDWLTGLFGPFGRRGAAFSYLPYFCALRIGGFLNRYLLSLWDGEGVLWVFCFVLFFNMENLHDW